MRFLAPLVPLFFFFLFSYAQTGSTGIPPNESKTIGKPLPNVTLIDSKGDRFKLYDLKGKPVIISPIYTHCNSACPLITSNLKKRILSFGTLGEEFYVLSLTFDPKDTLQDLRGFKERECLSMEGWKVVLVEDKRELFHLLDAMDFRFATLPDRNFVHPNLILFVDKDMVMRKYMYGVSFDTLEFSNSLKIAKGELALPDKFRGYLFLIGMLGSLGTVVYTVVRLTKAGYRRKTPA